MLSRYACVTAFWTQVSTMLFFSAARISQAFSATHRGFPLDTACIKKIRDIERNGKCFTEYAHLYSNLNAYLTKADVSRYGTAVLERYHPP